MEDRGWIDLRSSIFHPREWKTMGSGIFITGTDTGVGKTFCLWPSRAAEEIGL